MAHWNCHALEGQDLNICLAEKILFYEVCSHAPFCHQRREITWDVIDNLFHYKEKFLLVSNFKILILAILIRKGFQLYYELILQFLSRSAIRKYKSCWYNKAGRTPIGCNQNKLPLTTTNEKITRCFFWGEERVATQKSSKCFKMLRLLDGAQVVEHVHY